MLPLYNFSVLETHLRNFLGVAFHPANHNAVLFCGRMKEVLSLSSAPSVTVGPKSLYLYCTHTGIKDASAHFKHTHTHTVLNYFWGNLIDLN